MSFLTVLQGHEFLNALFLEHQEALLQLDLERAAGRLQQYEHELHRHMQIEEELLPVYARAGKILGGPPEFFTGKHQRIRELLRRIVTTLDDMQQDSTNLPRRVIALLMKKRCTKVSASITISANATSSSLPSTA
jgi:hemerythrin-like domain-containing protein